MKTKYLLTDNLYAYVDYDYDPPFLGANGHRVSHQDFGTITINSVELDGREFADDLSNQTLDAIKEHCLEQYRNHITG